MIKTEQVHQVNGRKKICYSNIGGIQMFNKLKAKELTIKTWQYLADYPFLTRKDQVPFVKQLSKMKNYCPLCELFFDKDCKDCPLQSCYIGSLYQQWLISKDDIGRHQAAQSIVDVVKNWRI